MFLESKKENTIKMGNNIDQAHLVVAAGVAQDVPLGLGSRGLDGVIVDGDGLDNGLGLGDAHRLGRGLGELGHGSLVVGIVGRRLGSGSLRGRGGGGLGGGLGGRVLGLLLDGLLLLLGGLLVVASRLLNLGNLLVLLLARGGLRGGRAVLEAGELGATGKLLERAGRGSGAEGGDGAVALALLGVDMALDAGAGVHALVLDIAGVDDLLEKVLVPRGEEVGVQRVASHVTVGEDEGLGLAIGCPAVVELLGVPVDFEEQAGHVDVALGAVHLAVAAGGGEGHVLLVVGEADVGVVARREVDIGAEGRGHAVALLQGEADTLVVVGGRGHAAGGAVGVRGPRGRVLRVAGAGPEDVVDVTEAGIEVLGTAAGEGLAQIDVTGHHGETLGEGDDVIIGGIEARRVLAFTPVCVPFTISNFTERALQLVADLQVVHVRVQDRDGLEGARTLVVVVELGHPVRGLVALDLGAGAAGLGEGVAGGVDVEVLAAENGVLVRRLAAGVDDRIDAAVEDLLAVEAHDGEGEAFLSSHGGAREGGAGDEPVLHGDLSGMGLDEVRIERVGALATVEQREKHLRYT